MHAQRTHNRSRASIAGPSLVAFSLVVIAIVAGCFAIHHAQAQPVADDGGYYVVAPPVAVPPGEARGCYFYRGRRHCGRYCYIEVDGKRYCRERAREAYPQGVIAPEYLEILPSMK